MLNKDFYTIKEIQQKEERYSLLIELNEKHKIFEAHFPQMPILPGVCSLQILKECVNSVYKCSLKYEYISKCNFVSFVNPNEGRELTFSFKLNEMNLVAEVKKDDAVILRINSLMCQDNEPV